MIEEIKDKKSHGGQAAAVEFLAQRQRPPTLPPTVGQQGTLAKSGNSGGVFQIPDRVTISDEAREKEDLQGMRRVNLESWALTSSSQTKSHIHKQQGAASNGVLTVERPKSPPPTPGADLTTPWAAANSNSLDAIGIGEAAQAQVVRKGDATRKTTSFITDYEAPVVTRE